MNRSIRSIFSIAACVLLGTMLLFASPKGKRVTIKVTASAGGMIQPVSSPRPSEMLSPPRDPYLREGTYTDTLNKGSNRFYAVVPCEDYRIDSLIVDGALTEFPNQNPMLKISQYRWPIWAFRELTTNHSLRVVFHLVGEIAISASAGEGGSITPSGRIVVSKGSEQQFTSKPLPRYRLVHIIVDDRTFDATESYTFTNVTVPHIIQAVFEKIEN